MYKMYIVSIGIVPFPLPFPLPLVPFLNFIQSFFPGVGRSLLLNDFLIFYTRRIEIPCFTY